MQVAGDSPPVFNNLLATQIATGVSANLSTILGSTQAGSLIRLTAPSTNSAPVFYSTTNPATAANGVPIDPGTEKWLPLQSTDPLYIFSAVAQVLGVEVYK
jgi:hypothetical protein